MRLQQIAATELATELGYLHRWQRRDHCNIAVEYPNGLPNPRRGLDGSPAAFVTGQMATTELP